MRNKSKYLHDLEAYSVRYDRERAPVARPVSPVAPMRVTAPAPRPDLADYPTVRAMRARALRRATLRSERARERVQEFARALTDEERAWFRGARPGQ